jgi:hypothetical protein
MQAFATIWDGINFRQVPPQEAEELEAADKCQNLTKKFYSGTELKFRRQFTGYKTRELRAEIPPVVSIPTAAEPAKMPTIANWPSYRKAAAAYLNKPFNKTTKDETIAYMENQLGLATV